MKFKITTKSKAEYFIEINDLSLSQLTESINEATPHGFINFDGFSIMKNDISTIHQIS